MQPVCTTDHARPAVPFAVATGGILLFTTVDAVVKWLPRGVPVTEIVALCFVFAIPVALVAVWSTGARWPTLASWKANVPRGVLRTGSTMLFFVALRRLPFAEVLVVTESRVTQLHTKAILRLKARLAGTAAARAGAED